MCAPFRGHGARYLADGMAKVRLTDKYVAAITALAGQRLEVFDQHPQGARLMLRVTDTGRKAWQVRYRSDDGTQRRFSLGLYPDVDLAAARDRASEARRKARDGEDPSADKRRRRSEAKAQPLKTFIDLSEAYFTACENGEWKPRGKKKRASTLAEEKGLWNRHIKGELGDLRLEDVTPAAVRKLLRALVAKGHEVTSNRVRAQIRQMINFAISEERLTLNPVAKVPPLGTEQARERVLRDQEMKAIWAALVDPSELRKPPEKDAAKGDRVYVSRPVCIALQLLSLLLTRRAEVAGMRRHEVDLQQGVWVIPSERTKNGTSHMVPLPSAAVQLISEADDLARQREETRAAREGREAKLPADYPLFPGARDNLKPITPAALTHALRDIKLALGLEDLHPHDLRRTGASHLVSERVGVSPFLVGRLLNHSSETGGAAMVTLKAYAVHDFASDKRRALEAWEALLLDIVGEKRRDMNITELRRPRI